jgi:hypothetical protein
VVFREDKMRSLLAAVAMSLVASVLPASAQGGGGCAEWCRINRCTGGISANMGQVCINKCTAACEAKRKGKKS